MSGSRQEIENVNTSRGRRTNPGPGDRPTQSAAFRVQTLHICILLPSVCRNIIFRPVPPRRGGAGCRLRLRLRRPDGSALALLRQVALSSLILSRSARYSAPSIRCPPRLILFSCQPLRLSSCFLKHRGNYTPASRLSLAEQSTSCVRGVQGRSSELSRRDLHLTRSVLKSEVTPVSRISRSPR